MLTFIKVAMDNPVADLAFVYENLEDWREVLHKDVHLGVINQ